MNERSGLARSISGYIRLVTHSLLHRKLRASLTVLGIVIGISIVLALVFLGNGLQRSITGQLQQFGTDLIFMLPRDATDPFGGVTAGGSFDDDHVDAVERVPGVSRVMPIITRHRLEASFRGEEKVLPVEARPHDLIQSFLVESLGIRLAEGRWMASEEAREIVIGSNLAENGFRDAIRVGDPVDLDGRRVTVVGILQPYGDATRDNIVALTLGLFRDVTGLRGEYDGMLAKVDPGRDIEQVGGEIEYALSREEDIEEFSVLTPARSQEVVSGVIGTVQSALFLIASVAVIVAGIGVMNTMYTSVLERTREIGIMKAVGAKSWHVMTVFLFESVILGGIGGALGILGGAAVAELVAFLARSRGFDFFEADLDIGMVGFVIVFTMVTGFVAGVLPSRQAAKKRPVEALRYR